MILEGIRIIDFSQYIPGAYATLRLAEMGAEVIKVEPLSGDPSRTFGQQMDALGVVFEANNRNKKSITINLKTAEGQRIAQKLTAKADIVIESFRPGIMKKLNLDYATVKERNQKVIYLSLSGYGQEGGMAHFGSHDLNYISLGGVLSQLKDEKNRPILPSLTFADIVGGYAASESILGALFQRERTGEGKYIDLSLMDNMLSFMNTNIIAERMVGKDNVISQLGGQLVSYNLYETKDNRYVSLAALEPKFWENFCRAVHREDWIPAHLTIRTQENLVYHQVKELFLSRTIDEWSQFGLEVDCCMTPILEVKELEKHPYILEKRLLEKKGTAPRLGEHTKEIFTDLLGMTEEEFENLKEKRVI